MIVVSASLENNANMVTLQKSAEKLLVKETIVQEDTRNPAETTSCINSVDLGTSVNLTMSLTVKVV